MPGLLTAGVKWATNHVIARIPSYTLRHAWYRHVLGWYMGTNVTILMGQHVHLRSLRTNGARVSIGVGTVIDHDCLLSTTGGLLIGEQVYISPGVWLVTGSHDIHDPDFSATYQPIVIDDFAWIGPRATILGGVTIGRGSIVRAGAVVAQDVEPYSVVAGIPATLRERRKLVNPSYVLNYRPLLE